MVILQIGGGYPRPLPYDTRTDKILVVVVDHFTKWVEAELVASILAKRIKQFYWRKIIYCFSLPIAIMSDNGSQFASRSTAEFYEQLKYKQLFTVWKKQKADEWRSFHRYSSHTILCPQSTTNETPFCLMFGIEAMILAEIREPSPRTTLFRPSENKEELRENLNLQWK
ncbi:hypothetical protein CR513_29945, partial [Mucuna pruriens]